MRVFMAALQAPGNVEALIRPLQDALFQERGWASARALPPLLPLAYADDADNLVPEAETHEQLEIGGLVLTEAALVVPVRPAPTGSRGHAPVTRLPPVEVGLFVAVNEEGVKAETLSELMPGSSNADGGVEVPVTSVRQWWYVILELVFDDPQEWWHSLRRREIDRVRLRKGR